MYGITQSGIISLSRGDTLRLPLFINCGTPTNPVNFDFNDNEIELYMGIMEPGQPFEKATVRKKYTSKDFTIEVDTYYDTLNVILELRPEDTIALCPGRYYYQVKLRYTKSGEVYTLFPKRQFIILE